MTEAEWDDVVRVHLKGHFAALGHAGAYWREQARSAAKAGIATLTPVAAAGLGRYGVTVNAIASAARTRMTEQVFAHMMARPDSGFDAMDPANVSPVVVWLASPLAPHVTGRVFEVEGASSPSQTAGGTGPVSTKAPAGDPAEIGPAVDKLIAAVHRPHPVYGAGG